MPPEHTTVLSWMFFSSHIMGEGGGSHHANMAMELDHLEPYFYMLKLGFTGVSIIRLTIFVPFTTLCADVFQNCCSNAW